MTQPPAHWSQLTGPSGWFSLHVPPDWEHSEVDGIHTLQAEAGDSVILISASWNADVAAEERLTAVVEALQRSELVSGTNLNNETALAIDYPNRSLSGDVAADAGMSWWQRFFTRPLKRRWRAWGIWHGPVTVLVTVIHEKSADHELETLLAAALRTIQFNETPADPPELFAERVRQLVARKYPLLDCRPGEKFDLTVGSSSINLFNFYRLYVQNPERFEEIMLPALTALVQIQGWGSTQTDPDLDDVRARIMPMLYPDPAWTESLAECVATPWVGGLAVLYVVDEANAYWYIRNDLMQRWNLHAADLEQIAMQNLEAYFDREPMEIAAAGEEGTPLMLMPGKSDSYNATRLLSESFRTKLRGVVQADLVVGLPGRDFFVAINAGVSELIEQVQRRVAHDLQQIDHPLTDRLLLVTADGVSELVRDPEEETEEP